MKKLLAFVLALTLLVGITGCGKPGDTPPATTPSDSTSHAPSTSGEAGRKYPEGKMVVYGYGQPQFMKQQYELWFEMHPEETKGISLEVIQTEGGEDARKKVTLSYTSGAFNEMPDVVQTGTVQMKDMAKSGILKDLSDYLRPLESQMVEGVLEDVKYQDGLYALPDSYRPNLLFYNKEIFDKYGIDPARMDTMEGYIAVGEELKQKSDGKVFLSFISPTAKTWSYWGRRGLFPQANARIWDDQGNVVFGSDPGVKLAMDTFDKMMKNDLLLRSQVMQPPLYDSIRNGEVATFYIGAFWDEFIRKNTPEIAGKWRMMTSPKFETVGKRGAPVTGMLSIVNKPEMKYDQLFMDIWYDYMFTAEYRNEHANRMMKQDAPCWNPISKELLKDPFWQTPDPFYGDQSFKGIEATGLDDCAANMIVTSADAEADKIISDELDRYIAGDQDINQTIAKIDETLKSMIGTAEID